MNEDKKLKALNTPTDAEYVRWVRLGANDKQILAIRNELRERRIAGEKQAELDAHNEMAHITLQKEATTLLAMLGYLLHVLNEYANDSGEVVWFDDGDGNPQITFGQKELDAIGGKRLDIITTEDKKKWILTLRQGE